MVTHACTCTWSNITKNLMDIHNRERNEKLIEVNSNITYVPKTAIHGKVADESKNPGV